MFVFVFVSVSVFVFVFVSVFVFVLVFVCPFDAEGGCNRYLGNAQIEVMLNSKVLP